MPRPRLEQALRPGPGQLVMLQAPAGFGKSLALLGAPGEAPRVWYNVDPTDSDPTLFAARLATVLGAHAYEEPGTASPAALAAALAMALPAGPATLDLDGCEHLQGSLPAGALLSSLLDLAGDQLALRIASRVRPPLRLERLGLAGDLEEIGPEELRFDIQETREFLSCTFQRKVSAAEARRFDELLEGWPAGLALTALAGEPSVRPHSQLSRYISEEVLALQDPEALELLGALPVGAVFDRSTVESLTGLPHAPATLDRLVRERFFLASVDGGFRLHRGLAAHTQVGRATGRRAANGGDAPAPAAPALEIRTLGRFEVLIDGQPVPTSSWRPSSAVRLLELLLSQPHYAVMAEEAAETLWPGNRRDSALNSFNVALHALRRIIQPGLNSAAESRYIVRESGHYRLRVDEIDIDVRRFEALAAKALETGAVADVEDALHAYTGDFLADVLYLDFPHDRREHLKVTYLEALENAGRLHLLAGEAKAGLAWLQRLLAIDSCREDIWTLVISHHITRGEHAAAARAYQRCERALKDALGVNPGPELESLVRGIRADAIRLAESVPLRSMPGATLPLPTRS